MPADEDRASRLKSEQVRDELNRLIREPVAAPPSGESAWGEQGPSYFKDPSTKDGQLRYDGYGHP